MDRQMVRWIGVFNMCDRHFNPVNPFPRHHWDLESSWPCTSIVTTAVPVLKHPLWDPARDGVSWSNGVSNGARCPGRCHLTYLIKKDGWINEVGPAGPAAKGLRITSLNRKTSDPYPGKHGKHQKIWDLRDQKAGLKHIHLIWISDDICILLHILSALSPCFLCKSRTESQTLSRSIGPCFARMDLQRKTVKSYQSIVSG